MFKYGNKMCYIMIFFSNAISCYIKEQNNNIKLNY